MKKLIASAGLVALGSVTVQAATAPGLTRLETAKPWSISASLRGFYDSNYNTAPREIAGVKTRRDSFGFELSPTAAINLPLDQSFLGASYTYSMRFFEDRDRNRADHSHLFNAKFDHAFSPNYRLELNNSLAIANEPEIHAGGVPFVFRTEQSYLRNRASAFFNAQFADPLGVRVGYQNAFWDYKEDGFAGSLSSRLDRMEHLASADLRYQILRPTVAVFGYQFGITDYLSNDPLATGIPSEFRDTRSHYIYVGADHAFTPQFRGSARVGALYTDYHRLPGGEDNWGPYADANLTYHYAQGSFVQGGVRHQRIPTDLLGVRGVPITLGNLILDQEATSVYASVTHAITSSLSATALGQFQHAEFEGRGGFDGSSEQFFIAGVNLNYRFNQHFSAETGYNYDKLNSEIPIRGFTRNRVYVGVRATF